jgi:hypothetical protein
MVDGPPQPSSPAPQPAAPPPAGADPRGRGVVFLTPGEFFWVTMGVWIGGIFILALTPVLLIPRLGMPLGVSLSYLLFFLAWQPVQLITQRTFGMRAGIVRMLLFVAAAATIAFYLREILLGMVRG